MALKQSTQAAGKAPVPSADGATDLIPIIGDYVLTGDEAANDIIEMAPLPAGYVPVDVIVDSADLGTTATASVGLLSAERSEEHTSELQSLMRSSDAVLCLKKNTNLDAMLGSL